MNQIKMTYEEWVAEGERLFGKNKLQWKFQCPVCGYVAKAQDWLDAGASVGQVGFSCIGRALGAESRFGSEEPGPCDYAGGGLFRLNPVLITEDDGTEHQYFAFAEE